MSYVSNAAVDYRTDDNPAKRAVAVLQRQSIETVELQAHVDRARQIISGTNAPTVCSLLDGLSGELEACCALLQKRIALRSSGTERPRTSDVEWESYWQLYSADGSDCPSHLEALLSGYAHYSRATSDSIEFLERLGDEESVKVLESVAAAADKGLWFIDLYLEGLALHMDIGHFPEFSPTIGFRKTDDTVANPR